MTARTPECSVPRKACPPCLEHLPYEFQAPSRFAQCKAAVVPMSGFRHVSTFGLQCFCAYMHLGSPIFPRGRQCQVDNAFGPLFALMSMYMNASALPSVHSISMFYVYTYPGDWYAVADSINNRCRKLYTINKRCKSSQNMNTINTHRHGVLFCVYIYTIHVLRILRPYCGWT